MIAVSGQLAGRCKLKAEMRGGRTFLCAALLASAFPAFGDQEAGNVVVVRASEHGRCYAKSVPDDLYGGKGNTTVFRVSKGEDVPLHSYNWFSQRIFIECNVSDSKTPVGVAVVRLGPWPRGHQATSEQLAIGFNFKGNVVKEYSTLDIAGSPDNVSRSVSHYTVIRKALGFRRLSGNEYAFEIETTSGRTLALDPATGEIIR
ncbi:MAG: hypothetical protein GY953_55535 [bacterium]|nr:hypothetical protein [bacterium]